MANNTIFDDAYKTLIEKYPRLIIPVINEQFGRNYEENESIENLGQELQKPEGDVAADSIFKICNRMYHVECQSNPDGTIAVRMLEYDFYIAMRNVAKDEQGKYTVEFPKSAVLYLRHNSETPKSMSVTVKVSEKLSFAYDVPIIKLQLYSLKELLEKRLYLYLPFYLLRYEKDVEEIEANEEKLETIVEEYRGLIEKLDEIYKLADDTTQRLIREVERQMKGIVEYTFKQKKEARNKLGGAIMGGTVMKTVEEEIEELKKTIKEKEVALEQAMAEKEDTIKEKEAALAEAMAEIERLKNQNAG